MNKSTPQQNEIQNSSGSCTGSLGPLGTLTPDTIILIEHSGILRFEASQRLSPTVRRLVTFELPANIQSGKHSEWARAFSIHIYDDRPEVESYRGLEGDINLTINRTAQEFRADLSYKTYPIPSQESFPVSMSLNIIGFNKLIVPT